MKRSFQNPRHFRDTENLCVKTSPPAHLSFKDMERGRRAVRVMCLLHNTLLLILTPLLFLTAIIGCSNSHPISPADSDSIVSDNSVPIIAPSTIPDGFTATGILGSYDFTINPDDLSYELTPSRSLSLGQSYIVNAKSFFTITPCATCLKIKGIAYDYPWIRADFLVSHPFEKGNVSEPPSGKNRLDLDIFDPILVVVPLDEPPTEPHLLDMEIYSESCGFADGYTRELAEVIDKEFACPYFLVVDDSYTGISTWNRFEMGRKDQQFSGWFEGGHFELFLTFGYGISTRNYTERLNPTYYNPEFNRKAAWKVNVIPPEYGWSPDDSDDKRDVIVEVYDWQIGATIDPALADPSSVYESSEILGVGIEISGMTNTLQIQTVPDGSHTGRPDDPLIYIVSIANENFLPGGYYTGYVKVLDKRVPPQQPFDGQTDSLIDIPDGVTMDFVSMPEFATYQIFTAEVWTNEPPCADLDVSDYFIDSGRSIQMWPGPATDDPDGVIIRYEYDFDYQGGIFYPEASNTTGDPVTSPPFYNDEFGQITHKVAMRVMDNGTPQKSDVGVETITIYPENRTRWVNTWGCFSGGGHYCQGENVTVDFEGNIYACGSFNDSTDFDPGPGEDIHTPVDEYDAFLTKYTANGQFLWAVNWGDYTIDGEADPTEAHDIVTDSNGNIYITGQYEEADFDPGPGEYLCESDTSDLYLMKLTKDGDFIWARTAESDSNDALSSANSITIDGNDNVLITGWFRDRVDFDPTSNIEFHYVADYHRAIFLCKYDRDANYKWTKSIAKENGSNSLSIRTDNLDDVYITGGFISPADFDPDPEGEAWQYQEYGGAFIAKYDPDGSYIWAKSWGGIGSDISGTDLDIFNSESIAVAGSVYGDGDIDFNPGSGVDIKTGSVGWDIFISTFDTNGNYLWGHRIGSTGWEDTTGMSFTDNGDIFITGNIFGSGDEVDFDPGDSTDIKVLYNNGNAGYLLKLDQSGNYLGTRLWGDTAGDSGYLFPFGIAVDNNYSVYITGYYLLLIDFDPSSYGYDYKYSFDDGSIFLCKL